MAEFNEENEQQGNHVYDDYGDEQEDEIEIGGDTGAMLCNGVCKTNER